MTVNVSNGFKRKSSAICQCFFNNSVVIASRGVLILGIRNLSFSIGYIEIT